jgi:hypothetical protein
LLAIADDAAAMGLNGNAAIIAPSLAGEDGLIGGRGGVGQRGQRQCHGRGKMQNRAGQGRLPMDVLADDA